LELELELESEGKGEGVASFSRMIEMRHSEVLSLCGMRSPAPDNSHVHVYHGIGLCDVTRQPDGMGTYLAFARKNESGCSDLGAFSDGVTFPFRPCLF